MKTPKMVAVNSCEECRFFSDGKCILMLREVGESLPEWCPLPHLCGFHLIYCKIKVYQEEELVKEIELPVHYALKMFEGLCDKTREEIFDILTTEHSFELTPSENCHWEVVLS